MERPGASRFKSPKRLLPFSYKHEVYCWRRTHEFSEIVPVSAMAGTYCAKLLDMIVARLPEHPPFFPADATSDQPETFYVAEVIREKIFHLTRQEVPYAVAVRVE